MGNAYKIVVETLNGRCHLET